MASLSRTAAILLCCHFLFLATGCLPQIKPPREALPVFSADLPPEQYAPAIATLQEDAAGQTAGADKENIQLHLAWLYVSYKNPGRDYRKALEHITRYITAKSGNDGLYDARNLQSLLIELDATQSKSIEARKHDTAEADKLKEALQRQGERSRQLQTKADRLEQENQELLEANATLRSNNQELASYNKSLLEKNKQFEETIERLKTLEMQLERKRKNFK